MPKADEPELLDGHACEHNQLHGNFGDIERINRLLGGAALTILGIRSLSRHVHGQSPLTILDVGTGVADIPKAVCDWGRHSNRRFDITATDMRSEILNMADISDYPEITLEVADVLNLPYGDGEFDMVVCSMLLHHFMPEDASKVLSEMARVARVGIVVNDLVRNSVSHQLARGLSRLMTRNRMTRHDGPLSVRRAYTLGELVGLYDAAKLTVDQIDQRLLYRVAITTRLAA